MTVNHSAISVTLVEGVPHLACSGNATQRDMAIARKWAILGKKESKNAT